MKRPMTQRLEAGHPIMIMKPRMIEMTPPIRPSHLPLPGKPKAQIERATPSAISIAPISKVSAMAAPNQSEGEHVNDDRPQRHLQCVDVCDVTVKAETIRDQGRCGLQAGREKVVHGSSPSPFPREASACRALFDGGHL